MIEDDTKQLELWLRYCYSVCDNIRRRCNDSESFYINCTLAGVKVTDKEGFVELYFNNLEKRKQELELFNKKRPQTEEALWVTCK